VSSTAPAEGRAAHGTPEEAPRQSITEAVLDNLTAWTVVAASITVLYLVWATLDIVSHYTGDIPKLGP